MYSELVEERPEIQPAPPKVNKRANYATVVIYTVLIYIMNNLVSNVPHPLDQYASKDYPGFIVDIVNWVANYQVPFLTHDFVSCLWAINLALFFGLMGNFVLLLYRPNWFRHLMQAVISATGFLAVFLVLQLFPLDISSAVLTNIIRASLILIMVGLAFGLMVELIKFVRSPISAHKKVPRDSDGPPQIQ